MSDESKCENPYKNLLSEAQAAKQHATKIFAMAEDTLSSLFGYKRPETKEPCNEPTITHYEGDINATHDVLVDTNRVLTLVEEFLLRIQNGNR